MKIRVVMVMMMMIIVTMIVTRMTPTLTWTLNISRICIQGVRGYFGYDQMITGTHYYMDYFIDLIMKTTGKTVDIAK